MATDPNPSRTESEVSALQDAGYDTSDAGTGNKTVTPASVGEMTGDTSKAAAHAEHVANDDMAEAGDMGIPANRHGD